VFFRVGFGQVFGDGQGVPDGQVTIDQHRHLACGRDAGDRGLELRVGVEAVEAREHFLERNARLAQQHPGAHGPGGVVLVADVELEHGSPAEEKGPQKSGPLCGNALRLV
jgi:hypothetical protein